MNPLSIRGVANWEDPEEGPAEIDIIRTKHMSVVVYCFDEGHEMTPHKSERDMAIYVESGRIVVMNGEGKVEMGPNQFIVIPAGQSRGIEARERAICLVTQSPPETY
jgi:quercetin dioxygenase-like cupin family protein